MAACGLDGSSARYSGFGTVNGEEGYGFLVAVTDGPDGVWMKIWNLETGAVAFDNQAGDPDDAAASQRIRAARSVHGG